jgi:hypothetical protein
MTEHLIWFPQRARGTPVSGAGVAALIAVS